MTNMVWVILPRFPSSDQQQPTHPQTGSPLGIIIKRDCWNLKPKILDILILVKINHRQWLRIRIPFTTMFLPSQIESK
jgi:hypothetical protein